MNKISNLAKKVDKVAKFLFGLNIFAGGILLLLFLVVLFQSEAFFSDMNPTVSLGAVSFELSPTFVVDNGYTKIYVIGIFVLALFIVFYHSAQIAVVRKILKPMTFEKPFANCVSKNIRKLAWIMLIGDGVCGIMDYVLMHREFYTKDFSTLFLNENIISCTFDYTFDITFIGTFVIIYLLSYVFQYGEMLQIESDEKL